MKNRIGWATLALAVVTIVTPITASARVMGSFRNVNTERVDTDRYNQDRARFDRDDQQRGRMQRGHEYNDGRRFDDRDDRR